MIQKHGKIQVILRLSHLLHILVANHLHRNTCLLKHGRNSIISHLLRLRHFRRLHLLHIAVERKVIPIHRCTKRKSLISFLSLLSLLMLYHGIVSKRLSLAVRRLQPLIKGSLRHSNNLTKSLPVLGVVGKISLSSSCLIRIAIHHLMLVKFTSLWIYLVYYYYISIEVVKVSCIIDEHINMVTIHAYLAQNIAISIVHGHAPRLALLVLTATSHALWSLNSEVIATKRQMPLLIVTCLLLRLSRLSLRFCDSIFQSVRKWSILNILSALTVLHHFFLLTFNVSHQLLNMSHLIIQCIIFNVRVTLSTTYQIKESTSDVLIRISHLLKILRHVII